MNKENYSEMSDEELRKKLKTMNFAFGLMAGSLLTALVLNLFVNKKGFWATIVPPLALTPLLMIIYNSIKAIKTEIKSRDK
jgi:Na+(H+)/acetate symporter ActP